MTYTCPDCKKVYTAPPKHCPCTPLNIVPYSEVNYYIKTPNGIKNITEKEHKQILSSLEKKGKIKNKKRIDIKDSDYLLVKQSVEFGIETGGVNEEEIPLTKEEFESM